MHSCVRRRDAFSLRVLEPRARAMRFAPTPSEDALWQLLRRGALGVRFRRQVVLGPYVVDFCAPSVRLVVEVDGAVHARQAERDAERTRWLEAHGWRVMRVDARAVTQRPGEVVATLSGLLRAP